MSDNVKLTLEALNLQDNPNNYMHPSKKKLAEKPHEVEAILPDETVNNSRFYETLTSKSYELCVKKLAHYLGLSIGECLARYPNCYAFTALISSTLGSVIQVETNHKAVLERLAIKICLELPEFELLKEQYENGTLKITATLGSGDLSEATTEVEQNQEQIIDALEPELEHDPERKLKRVFHNFIVQGNAVHKSYLFNMASEELNAIDETLVNKYGMSMAVIHTLYYGTPHFTGEQLKQAAAGSSQIEGDHIDAKGLIFPVLVHEIVKGLVDFLGQDVSPETHGSETLEDEFPSLMAGPELFARFNKMLPHGKERLFPIIYRLLLKKSPEEIKQVIANSPQGKQTMTHLAIEAERMLQADQQQPEEEYEPWQEEENDDDRGF